MSANDPQPGTTPEELLESFTPTMEQLSEAWLSYRLGDDMHFADPETKASITAEFWRAINNRVAAALA